MWQEAESRCTKIMDRSIAISLGCTNTSLSRCFTPQFGRFKGKAIGSTRLRIVQTEKSSLKPMKAMAKEVNPRYAELEAAINVALPLVHPEGLYEAMRYAVGGRHLFAFICLTACELVGGNSDVAMAVACAVEMCVASALIQDDFPCLDNATMRRGKPTTHKAFGESTAFLAMTTLIGIAFENIVKAQQLMSVERKVRLVEELARTMVRAGWGQYMDAQEVEGEAGDDAADLIERLDYINKHKAAPWFEVAMVMGGIAGGGSNEQIDLLRKFGLYVGLMHTLIDEVNDATLSTEAMGKDAGLDSQNKKRNFLTVLGQDKCLEMADHLSRQAKMQLAGFENKTYTAILEELVEMYRTHGVTINNPTFSRASTS